MTRTRWVHILENHVGIPAIDHIERILSNPTAVQWSCEEKSRTFTSRSMPWPENAQVSFWLPHYSELFLSDAPRQTTKEKKLTALVAKRDSIVVHLQRIDFVFFKTTFKQTANYNTNVVNTMSGAEACARPKVFCNFTSSHLNRLENAMDLWSLTYARWLPFSTLNPSFSRLPNLMQWCQKAPETMVENRQIHLKHDLYPAAVQLQITPNFQSVIFVKSD